MVKKQGAKRRPWNKGLEVGKKGAFTPAQVKRIRQVLMAHGASGLRDLTSRRCISAPKLRASIVSAQTRTLIGLKPGIKPLPQCTSNVS
jgi:hypothetical protein